MRESENGDDHWGGFSGKSFLRGENVPGYPVEKGAEISTEELFCAEGVLGFHEFIRREMQAGRETESLAEELIRRNPGIILVSDEVGYGVVPVDAFDRAYRERVGRICTELAAFSQKVTRVICGAGMVIKDV